YSGTLHLLICGGAALADLKYQGGDLSLLNIAASEQWPELSVEDLQRNAANVPDYLLARALHLSGGHPLLAQAALTLLATPSADATLDDEAVIATLSTHPRLWEALLPLLRDPMARTAIEAWLERPRLAPARPYLVDPVLRQLYWHNLLTARPHADGAWLEWRCEAIRRTVRQVIDSLAGLPA
ncbi:hypothetical protein, partial [Stenotrophomonas sp. P5_B8]